MKKLIIVISGHIGSGKDYTTNIVAGHLGREARYKALTDINVVRFADPIKKGIAGMFGHHEDFLYSDKNKALYSPFDICKDDALIPITYGRLQQLFGDAMRDIDNDIFAKVLISKLDSKDMGSFIVPDLRFINELKYLNVYKLNKNYSKSTKFIFIKLKDVYKKKDDQRDLQHQSEIEVDKLPDSNFDYILDSNNIMNAIKCILKDKKVI